MDPTQLRPRAEGTLWKSVAWKREEWLHASRYIVRTVVVQLWISVFLGHSTRLFPVFSNLKSVGNRRLRRNRTKTMFETNHQKLDADLLPAFDAHKRGNSQGLAGEKRPRNQSKPQKRALSPETFMWASWNRERKDIEASQTQDALPKVLHSGWMAGDGHGFVVPAVGHVIVGNEWQVQGVPRG